MPPIRLLEENPRYLEFRGKPTVLVTSAEHYGAVLNADFDYIRYLDTLAAAGFNLTRTFAGTYLEEPGSFAIVGNTLAPAAGRFLSPWARSDRPGYPPGGNLFDLSRWDDAYFRRLKAFVAEADRRDIVVELVLFCFFYEDRLWAFNPMNAACNVNGLGAFTDRHRAFSLDDNPLLKTQARLIRKLVAELNEFDNLYYEIINEPYSLHDGTAFLPWQDRMTDVIVEAEAGLPQRHLVARNVQNRCLRVTDLHPAVSIVNFHYADPAAVAANYHLGRVIADDETGFKGQSCCPYRTEAWRFMLSGGGIFSHLDYSYTVAHPEGTAPIELESPSFGGPELRAQLGVLKKFLDALPLDRMSPHDDVLNLFGSSPGAGTAAHVLADPGRTYAAYLCSPGSVMRLGLGIPPGRYRVTWTRTTDGAVVRVKDVEHAGGTLGLDSPRFAEDIALRIDAA